MPHAMQWHEADAECCACVATLMQQHFMLIARPAALRRTPIAIAKIEAAKQQSLRLRRQCDVHHLPKVRTFRIQAIGGGRARGNDGRAHRMPLTLGDPRAGRKDTKVAAVEFAPHAPQSQHAPGHSVAVDHQMFQYRAEMKEQKEAEPYNETDMNMSEQNPQRLVGCEEIRPIPQAEEADRVISRDTMSVTRKW